MISIYQNWDFDYHSDDYAPSILLLLNHPRINYNVSKYIFSYIKKKILDKYEIVIQEVNHEILITFNMYNKKRKKLYLKQSPYNKVDIKYDYDIFTGDRNISKNKKEICYVRMNSIILYYYSKNIDVNMTSREYADIVYDMFGSYLINVYNCITKEIMDKNKIGMNYKYIDKFNHPSKKCTVKSCIQTNTINII